MRNESPNTILAIVRIDGFHDRDQSRFTVKELVRSESEAQAEVDRLNEINHDKGSRYFWQATRMRSS